MAPNSKREEYENNMGTEQVSINLILIKVSNDIIDRVSISWKDIWQGVIIKIDMEVIRYRW